MKQIIENALFLIPESGWRRCLAPSPRPGRIFRTGLALVLLTGAGALALGVGGAGAVEAVSVPAAPPVVLTAGLTPEQPLPVTPGRPRPTGPLSLDEAVKLALANQPGLGSAAAAVDVAAAQVGSARAMTRPSFSANTYLSTGSMGGILQSPLAVGAPQSSLGVPSGRYLDQNFSIMVPLYTGGRLGAEVRAAGARQGAAAQDYQATANDVVLATREAYRTAVFTREDLAVFQQYVAQNEESVRLAEERLRVGKIPRLDVLRYRTELANTRQQLANAQRDAEQAMIALKTTMGVSLDAPITLADRLAFTPVAGTLAENVALARKNRPEIAAAAARIQAAEAMATAARGSYKPQIYAAGMFDVNSASKGGSMNGYTAGVVASLPLADGGLRRAQVKAADAEQEQMRQEAENVNLMVARDVSDAWLMLQTAARNVETARTAVTEAEEGYQVMQQRYDAGRAVTVEVLDALSALTRARVNELQAIYEHNIARDRLERATGALNTGAQAAASVAKSAGVPKKG